MYCSAFIIILKIISVTCFNKFSKTKSEKNEEIRNRGTKYYIENIYFQYNPDFYNQITDEFQVQRQPPVVFFK